MRKIRFSIYFCGMSDDTFSAQIMIYKPQASISRDFDESLLQQLKITSINDLIVYMKTLPEVAEDIGFTGFDQFNIDAVYIQHCSYLLGFQDDKKIEDIFRDFPENQLNFAFLLLEEHQFTMKPAIDSSFIPTKKSTNICHMFMLQKPRWKYDIL